MSLHGTYDPENIFAKIIRGDAPAVTLFEDDDVIAFMDVFPQSRGHCLVVPKEPARNLLEVSEASATNAMRHVRRLTQAVEKSLSPDGVTVVQFNGAPAGQTVFHLHIHVIPNYGNEPLKGHGGGQMADMGELETLAAKIKAAL